MLSRLDFPERVARSIRTRAQTLPVYSGLAAAGAARFVFDGDRVVHGLWIPADLEGTKRDSHSDFPTSEGMITGMSSRRLRR